MRVTAAEVYDPATGGETYESIDYPRLSRNDMKVVAQALEAAYTFLTQPQQTTRETATYDVRNYNKLAAQLRNALRLATGGAFYGYTG